MERAYEALRKKGLAAAAKKSSRHAAEGLVGLARSPGGEAAAVVEVNSETDFVARNDLFRQEIYAATCSCKRNPCIILFRQVDQLRQTRSAQHVDITQLSSFSNFYKTPLRCSSVTPSDLFAARCNLLRQLVGQVAEAALALKEGQQAGSGLVQHEMNLQEVRTAIC